MPATIQVTPNKPFPSGIVGDKYPDLAALPGSLLVPSSFSGAEIDFDIQFGWEEGEDTTTVYEVIVDGELGIEGLTATIVGSDTVNIKGTPVNLFPDEVFRFVFPDGTEKDLPPVNTEPYFSIIKWKQPSSREILANYKFIIKYDDNPAATVPIVGDTVPVELGQYFYWKYEPSLALFDKLVKQGQNF